MPLAPSVWNRLQNFIMADTPGIFSHQEQALIQRKQLQYHE